MQVPRVYTAFTSLARVVIVWGDKISGQVRSTPDKRCGSSLHPRALWLT